MTESELQQRDPIAPVASDLIIAAERIALDAVTTDPDSDALALDIAAAVLSPTPRSEHWHEFVTAATTRVDDDRALPLVAHVARHKIRVFDDLRDPGEEPGAGAALLCRTWLSRRRQRVAARKALGDLSFREAAGETIDTALAAELDDRRVRLDGEIDALWRAVPRSVHRPCITRMRLAGVERQLIDVLLDPAVDARTATRVARTLGHLWQPFTRREIAIVLRVASAQRDAAVTGALLECFRGEDRPILNVPTCEQFARIVPEALAAGNAELALARARIADALGYACALPGEAIETLCARSKGREIDENLCVEIAYFWLIHRNRVIAPFMPAVFRILERRARPWPSVRWYWLELWLVPWEKGAWTALAADGLAELMRSTPLETASRVSPYSRDERENAATAVQPTAAWDAANPWHRRVAVRECWKAPPVAWGRNANAVTFGLIGLAESGAAWRRVLARAWTRSPGA